MRRHVGRRGGGDAHGIRTIFPAAPGVWISACARGASANGGRWAVTGAILPDAKPVATVEWIRSNCRGLALNSCIPRMSACLPLVKRGLIVVSPRLPITTTLPNGASRAKLWARFTFASISRDHVDPGWG